MNDLKPALRRRVGDAPSDALLDDLIMDARSFAMGYTGLDELPDAIDPLLVGYAAATYRRIGAEGESAHQEGDVSMTFDMERRDMLQRLGRYRVARAGLKREEAL